MDRDDNKLILVNCHKLSMFKLSYRRYDNLNPKFRVM